MIKETSSLLRKFHNSNKGISLVEITVSIVAIAALIALGLGLASLIDSAKTRSVVSQIESIDSASKAFESRYNAKPGDFSKATNIWGNSLNYGGTVHNITNGDNNGMVDDDESSMFALHLIAADLLNKNTVIANNGCIKAEFGENSCFKMRLTFSMNGEIYRGNHLDLSAFDMGSVLPLPAIRGDIARAIDIKKGGNGRTDYVANPPFIPDIVFVPGPEIRDVESAGECILVGPEYNPSCNYRQAYLIERLSNPVVIGGAGGSGGSGGSTSGICTDCPDWLSSLGCNTDSYCISSCQALGDAGETCNSSTGMDCAQATCYHGKCTSPFHTISCGGSGGSGGAGGALGGSGGTCGSEGTVCGD